MTCDVCGAGERREQRIRYTLPLDDGFVVIDHVPAIVCSHCGEVSLRPEVVESLQNTIWGKRPPARVISTLVYDFAS
jgi:HTH-type transcriptional regulator/antitoxin MqsA